MNWCDKSRLNTARSHPAVAVWDGLIYAIGGGGPNFKSLSSVEVYDPAQDKWSLVKDMPTTRSGAMAVACDGRIYVIGGGYKKPDGKFRFLPSVEIYDIATDTWEKGPDMLQPHDYPACVLLDDEVYIMAGHHPTATEGGPKTDTGFTFCEKLKTGKTEWQELTPLQVPRFGACAQVINGEIWVMGGVAFSSAGFNNYDIVEIYNPQTGTWRQEDDVKLAWPAAAFGSAYHNSKLYIMGGYSGNSIHDRVSVLEGAEWKDLAPMTNARAAIGTAVCNNRLYSIGGWADDGRTPIDDTSCLELS